MKYLLLIVFTLLMPVLFAQQREKLKKNKFNSAKFERYEVELKKKWFDSTIIKFADEVEFIDARADKDKLGFIRTGEANEFFNLTFNKETGNYINESIRNIITPKSKTGNKMVIVIRHFWLSQLIVKSGLLKSLVLGPKGFLSYCYFGGDCYTEKNGAVQFAGKIDTVIHLSKWMGHATGDLSRNITYAVLATGDSLIGKPGNSPAWISRSQLLDSVDHFYNYPILATQQPKHGIYLAYSDFLNNTPLEEDFELAEHKGDEYVQGKKTDTSITNKAWGFCNEEGIFKHINDEYYKMTRVQNTFELAGPRVIRKVYTKSEEFFYVTVNSFLNGLIGGATTILFMSSDKAIMNELVPYQLNIKDATFY